eukprot:GFYU01007456.1.p1 GENE.GFYU01007456.1~~GFYU01007456.1.p1  ORF type:complete len:351 (-),score=65.44 GFYU01007456.1:236-1288(-)
MPTEWKKRVFEKDLDLQNFKAQPPKWFYPEKWLNIKEHHRLTTVQHNNPLRYSGEYEGPQQTRTAPPAMLTPLNGARTASIPDYDAHAVLMSPRSISQLTTSLPPIDDRRPQHSGRYSEFVAGSNHKHHLARSTEFDQDPDSHWYANEKTRLTTSKGVEHLGHAAGSGHGKGYSVTVDSRFVRKNQDPPEHVKKRILENHERVAAYSRHRMEREEVLEQGRLKNWNDMRTRYDNAAFQGNITLHRPSKKRYVDEPEKTHFIEDSANNVVLHPERDIYGKNPLPTPQKDIHILDISSKNVVLHPEKDVWDPQQLKSRQLEHDGWNPLDHRMSDWTMHPHQVTHRIKWAANT